MPRSISHCGGVKLLPPAVVKEAIQRNGCPKDSAATEGIGRDFIESHSCFAILDDSAALSRISAAAGINRNLDASLSWYGSRTRQGGAEVGVRHTGLAGIN